MIYYNEAASDYHDRQAASAGLLWDVVGPDGCLALAFARSRWLNPDYVPERDEAMDSGVIAHLAALEDHLLEERITIVEANSWRTKAAQELRDEAYATGKIPILLEREGPGPSFQKILAMRKALQGDDMAQSLLFGTGRNEVSYDWQDEATGIKCKARADRITDGGVVECTMVDLKTAQAVSPDGFQRSMVRYGHHLRAAFYLDGWERQEEEPFADYVFVCVRSEPPHLVAVYQLEAQAIEWGRKLYRNALTQFERAQTGLIPWWSYNREGIMPIDLPTWAGYRLADREAAGEL